MSTTSKCCSPMTVVEVVAGAVVVAGVATALWMLFSRRGAHDLDPQAEIDRRINELEQSISRLQDIFDPAMGS